MSLIRLPAFEISNLVPSRPCALPLTFYQTFIIMPPKRKIEAADSAAGNDPGAGKHPYAHDSCFVINLLKTRLPPSAADSIVFLQRI